MPAILQHPDRGKAHLTRIGCDELPGVIAGTTVVRQRDLLTCDDAFQAHQAHAVTLFAGRVLRHISHSIPKRVEEGADRRKAASHMHLETVKARGQELPSHYLGRSADRGGQNRFVRFLPITRGNFTGCKVVCYLKTRKKRSVCVAGSLLARLLMEKPLCPRCGSNLFVQAEEVLTGPNIATSFHCRRCQHDWQMPHDRREGDRRVIVRPKPDRRKEQP